jgi:hypothetical protein
MVSLWALSVCVMAQELPVHCADARLRETLRAQGPVVSVGASASSGLFARSFPQLAALQWCLTKGDGYEARHSLFGGSQFEYLKRVYREQRPKLVIALDYLHHSGKRRRYTPDTLAYLDAEIARLTLDCRRPEIDCSPGGDFHFVTKDNYRPLVLLGDIYAFYALSCAQYDAFINADVHDKNVGCAEDYERINAYLHKKAAELPNLIVFPVAAFYGRLHRGLPFHYDLNGRAAGFYTSDLFWDGFHPRSDPGAPVLANLVLRLVNERQAAPARAPYIDIAERHLKPYTGLVVLGHGALPFVDGVGLLNGRGEALPRIARWTHELRYEPGARALTARVGAHPLVLEALEQREDGQYVLSDADWALLASVMADDRHRLLDGVMISPR